MSAGIISKSSIDVTSIPVSSLNMESIHQQQGSAGFLILCVVQSLFCKTGWVRFESSAWLLIKLTGACFLIFNYHHPQCLAALWIMGCYKISPIGGVESLAGLPLMHLLWWLAECTCTCTATLGHSQWTWGPPPHSVWVGRVESSCYALLGQSYYIRETPNVTLGIIR